jgi:hypothetical protein
VKVLGVLSFVLFGLFQLSLLFGVSLSSLESMGLLFEFLI